MYVRHSQFIQDWSLERLFSESSTLHRKTEQAKNIEIIIVIAVIMYGPWS